MDLFKALAAQNPPETILVSNTSSLSVSGIAAGLPHPSRVAGLHFFNPAPLMKLVEVVKAERLAFFRGRCVVCPPGTGGFFPGRPWPFQAQTC